MDVRARLRCMNGNRRWKTMLADDSIQRCSAAQHPTFAVVCFQIPVYMKPAVCENPHIAIERDANIEGVATCSTKCELEILCYCISV